MAVARRSRDHSTLDLFAHATIPQADAPQTSELLTAPRLHHLKPDALELRPYTDIARSAWKDHGNFGIVADTASGKTYLALLLADTVLGAGQRVLIIAPTNPLCDQHARIARSLFDLPDDAIRFVRSAARRGDRDAAWSGARIVVATPQHVAKRLVCDTRTLSDFGLVIIDECHHATERHASITVAEAAHAVGIRIIGLTASPGDTTREIERVRINLHLARWVEVPESATDPFRPPVTKQRITVPLTPALDAIVRLLESVIHDWTAKLATIGVLDTANRAPSPEALTRAVRMLRDRTAYASIPYAVGALELVTALTIAVAGDLTHALEVLRRACNRRVCARKDPHAPRTATARLLCTTPDIIAAGHALRTLVDAGTPHAKWAPLLAAITDARAANPDARILVYTRYATTAERLASELAVALACRVDAVLGRAHLPVRTAIARLDDFAHGAVRIVVATPVIREGLHIPAIDLLVEYAPPLNGIERTQLHGRVGRTASGAVVALVSDHDLDARYSYSAEAGVRAMRRILRASVHGPVHPAAPHHTHRSAFTAIPRKPESALAAHVRTGMVFERFAVRSAALRTTHHGRPYVEFIVGDRTGVLIVRHWCPDGAPQAAALLTGYPEGSIIIVRGYLDHSTPRIITVNPRESQSIVLCPHDDYDIEDYREDRLAG